MIVFPWSQLLAMLNILSTDGGGVAPISVHLFQNNFFPLPTSQLSDFVEATFSGYAASGAVHWGSGYYDVNGKPTVNTPEVPFLAASPLLIPNTIYGYYITDSGAGTTLYFAERFPAPIPVVIPHQSVILIPVLQAGSIM